MTRSKQSKQQQSRSKEKKVKLKTLYTVKKAGHSWRSLGITVLTGRHNTAAKQEIIKQHRGTDDRRLALKPQL